MHEVSLVGALLEQVRRLAQEHQATAVEEIHLEMGPLANVEPVLLRSAFEQLRSGPLFAKCRLCLMAVPLVGQCDRCQQRITLAELDFRCPDCGTGVRVVQGEGLILRRVTMKTRETT